MKLRMFAAAFVMLLTGSHANAGNYFPGRSSQEAKSARAKQVQAQCGIQF